MSVCLASRSPTTTPTTEAHHHRQPLSPQGSDQDTRRRCACDLVRALCQQFDEAVTAVCLEYIGNMVQVRVRLVVFGWLVGWLVG